MYSRHGKKRVHTYEPSSSPGNYITQDASHETPAASMWRWVSERKTVLARLAVFVSLIIAMALCGTAAYIIIDNQETDLEETQYYSVVDSALDTITDDIKARVYGTRAMAATYAARFPEAGSWPNVTLPGFDAIAKNTRLSSTRSKTASFFFAPVVEATQQRGFEAFASEYITSMYPPGVGSLAEGVVIWKLDRNLLVSGDPRVRDDGGATDWGSKYDNLLFPALQIESGPNSYIQQQLLMGNGHHDSMAGPSIDSMLDCVYSTSLEDLEQGKVDCGSGSLWGDNLNQLFGVMEPIYILDGGNATVVGIFSAAEDAGGMLEGVFPGFVQGIDVVIECGSTALTYSIIQGKVKFVAAADKHDSSYDNFREKRTLFDSGLLSASLVEYTISVYPNEEYFEYYETDTAWIATSIVVAIILLVSVIFGIYDFMMRRESNQKSEILEARRAFVRYISHEIRTPLNTVYLGLRLLEDGLLSRLAKSNLEASNAAENQTSETSMHDSAGFNSLPIQTSTSNARAPSSDLRNVSVDSVDSVDSIENNRLASSTTNTTAAAVAASNRADAPDSSASAASHDVTPADAVIPGIASATSSTKTNFLSDWLELCQDLVVNVNSAVALLTDILNYDKVQTGTLALDIAHLPAWRLIATTFESFAVQAQQCNITFSLDLEPDRLEAQRFSYPPSSSLPSAAAAVTPRTAFASSAGASTSTSAEDARRQSISELLFLGDDKHLVQVLRNLLSNALKFTPEGGTVTVTGTWLAQDKNRTDSTPQYNSGSCIPWAARRREESSAVSVAAAAVAASEDSTLRAMGTLKLTVTDTGAGLSDAQLSELFQEGVQFSRNRLQAGGGSGLGLSISKGIIAQHGGSLEASSEGVFKGCTFTLLLPVYTSSMPRRRSRVESPATSNDSAVNNLYSKSSGVETTLGSASYSGRESTDVVSMLNIQPGGAKRSEAWTEETEAATGAAGKVDARVDPGNTDIVGVGVGDRRKGESVGKDSGALCDQSVPASPNLEGGGGGCIGQQATSTVEEDTSAIAGSAGAGALVGSDAVIQKQMEALPTTLAISLKASLKILVVDDSGLNRKMMVRLLHAKGHPNVEEAVDGYDALAKYQQAITQGTYGGANVNAGQLQQKQQQDPFELILMDYEMPNMNGPTCTKVLRLMGCKIPIIGVTGNVLPADRELFVAHGANDVMGKPFEYSLLSDVLAAMSSDGQV